MSKIIDIEKIYSHLAKRLKRAKKELEELNQKKISALSPGFEKEAYLEVIQKEAEIRVIRQEIQFLETGSIELPEEIEERLKNKSN